MKFEEIPDKSGIPEEQPSADGGVGEPITIKSVGYGAAWNIIAQVLPQGLTLIQSLVVARLLGPQDQGIQSFMIFVAMTCATVFAVGLPLAVQKNVSASLGEGSAEKSSYCLHLGIRWSFIPGIGAAVVTLIVGRCIYQEHVWAWLIIAVYAAAVAVHAVSAQALLGLRQYRQASITGVVAQIIAVPVTVILLVAGQGILGIVIVTTLASVISAGVTIYLVSRARHRWGLRGRPDDAVRRTMRKSMIGFALGAGTLVLLETVVAQRSELAFLAVFHGDEPAHIAYYSVAFSAVQTAYKVPAALIPVVLPTVAALIAAGRMATVRVGYLQAQRLLLTASGAGAGLLAGIGPALIVLLWGEEYAVAGRILLIMGGPTILLGALTAIASSALLGCDRLKWVVWSQTLAAVVTLLGDIVLIGPFDIYGAAAANSLGVLASAVLLAKAARSAEGLKGPGFHDFLTVLIFLVLLAAPGIGMQLAGWNNIWCIVGGFGAYVVMFLLSWPLLKPLHPEDVDRFHEAIDRLPNMVGRWLLSGMRRTDRHMGKP
ncbi:lipopolysaccharide biosynthesis protein [Curtobacterium sp. S6]|uniref:lipopolysaccharide biosynthesis protein n=1 Tax=Curtobacterium sp. S6 TaxID=1479623 RepID=UPI0004ABCFE5|nr:oligosaccharide flippase family protein [Curtobacterium sp. S6]